MTTADVVVIGAGVVGASTALALGRRGPRVVLVERERGAGFGTTSASSAIVRFNYSTLEGVALSWEARAGWQEWSGQARLITCGLVFLDVEQAPTEGAVRLFDEVGVTWEHWDADQLAARLPWIDTGRWYPPKPITSPEFFADADSHLGALWTPDAGYVDDPRLAADDLLRQAETAGVATALGQAVTRLEQIGTGWRTSLSGGGRIDSAVVVNAAGPWAARLNELAGVGGDFAVTTRALRQEVHQVSMPASMAGRQVPVVADLDLGVYLRPVGGHALIVGGTEPECDPLEWIEDPDDLNPRATARQQEIHLTRAARRIPDLRIPSRTNGIASVYDVATDWTPIYDRTDRPGFYVAMGTSGNQFKNAPVVGELMATLIEAVESGHDHDADPVRLPLPRTGHEISLAAFSRRREPSASTGTVMG